MHQPLGRHVGVPATFAENIPTRIPRDGEPRRRVMLSEALEIAEAYYAAYSRHQINAAYCRARYRQMREQALL